MSRNKNLNQFDDLVDELKQTEERPSLPPTFKTELRGQLLDQYEQSGFSWGNVRQWAGTAVALGVLALIVFISWSSLSRQSGAASAFMDAVDVPGRDEFIVYDQLRIELPVWTDQDTGLTEMTAESWQSLDGTFFRGEVVDANGKQRVFAQADGQFLWRGTYDSNVERMETVSLQYFDVYHALAHAEGWAGNATTPPFYDDVGWDGLVQTVLRLDWQCEGAECVNKYLVEPPLGVSSRGGEYEPYGWGVSLIDTETTANGRSLTTYLIGYYPNQDGLSGSQYRLVKLDSSSHAVVEVADYDGETLLRRLERVTHQIMTSADLPEDQFTRLPPGTGVSYVLPEGRTTAETRLLAAPNGEPEATLTADTLVTLSGLMANQLAVVQNGTTWQYITVPGVGQGWVDEANLQWPLTSDGQLVDLDTSGLPTAVPLQTQLTILQTYRTELQAILPQSSGEEIALFEQALIEIEAEIARLEQQISEGETAVSGAINSPSLLTHHLSAAEVDPGETLAVTLFWEGEPAANTTIAVHLTDSSGTLLSQQDQPYDETMEVSVTVPETADDSAYNLVVIPYDATTGTRLDSLLLKEILVEAAVTSPTQHATNDVWLISATQYARTSTSDPVTLKITVGYQFESDEEVILKPLYANPNWESSSGGRIPIDGLSDSITLTEKSGTQTITFSANPDEMRQIVGTDQPVLVMQLGYLSEAENGRRELNILAMPTLTDFVIDLARTHEMQYYEHDHTAVVSGTGGNGLTLRSEPNGQQLGVLEEGSVVTLNDDPLLESEGLLWQSISTTVGEGWVVADFLDYPVGYTPNQLWITKAIQLPRTGPDKAITLEITVEYILVTAEEAVLSLSFIHPTWEETSLDGYRYPNFNALGDKYLVLAGTGSVTITATIDPETITSAIYSNEFRLMTRLWATDEVSQQTSDLILMGFDNGMTFDLESVKEISYEMDPSELDELEP